MNGTERPETIELECIAVHDETPTIKTFTFRVADRAIRHEAGQSMTLMLERDGEALRRTFSISSAPDEGGTFEMTIKAQQPAGATRWLHDTVTAGTRLQARTPRGHFTLELRSPKSRIAFISAGSGATPLMAMLRRLAREEPHADVVWLHMARAPDEVLFAPQLAALQERMPNLAVQVTVSCAAPGWIGYRGRLGRRMVSVMAPDLARREVFCCGPHAFMDDIRRIYVAEGGSAANVFSESFGAPALPIAIISGQADESAVEGPIITANGRILTSISGETVLQTCLRQGVIIPCGCGQGMCGTCLVRKVSGVVSMRHQGGMTADEEAQGFILACSARPETDISIAIG